MATEKFVTDNIKMGISDYLAMSVDNGQLYFHNLKVHDDLPDWIESSDTDVSVEIGYTENYLVPAGQGIEFDMTNLDPNGNFLIEILNSGSPKNYPDFLIENFSGKMPFQNKSLSDILVTLKITPIDGAATSSSRYNLKVSAINTWPKFKKSCDFYSQPGLAVVGAYPVAGKLGPFAVWDIFRHNNVRFDISVGFNGVASKMHKKIIYNVDDKMIHVFPKHFNTSKIDKIDISVTITVQDPEGIFSIMTKDVMLKDADLNELYGGYLEAYEPVISRLVEEERDYFLLQDEYLSIDADRHDHSKVHINSSPKKIYLSKESFNRKVGNGQPIPILQGTSNYISDNNIRSNENFPSVGTVNLPNEGY
tara:strand:+ start:30 stop:1121 length:1092 start_codon:yes stop_codon:yes gene_type:complete